MCTLLRIAPLPTKTHPPRSLSLFNLQLLNERIDLVAHIAEGKHRMHLFRFYSRFPRLIVVICLHTLNAQESRVSCYCGPLEGDFLC